MLCEQREREKGANFMQDNFIGHARSVLLSSLLGASLLTVHTAHAELDVQLLQNGEVVSTVVLSMGEQAILNGEAGTFEFAGHTLSADNVSGLIGFSSDAAFIAVAEGKLRFGSEALSRGQAIILPPFGVPPAIVRYDAARLIADWQSEQQSQFPAVYGQFQKVAKRQKRAIFFGRLTPTALNVAAPGSAEDEEARRSLVGADVIKQIRYQTDQAQGDIENAIVSAFVAGLKSKDVAAVAALLDPTPFGRTDMRGQPGQARLLMAQQLIDERDWARTLGNGDLVGDGRSWRVGGRQGLAITLRPIGDFAYISTIQAGESR